MGGDVSMSLLKSLLKRMPIAAQLFRYAWEVDCRLDRIQKTIDDLYQIQADVCIDGLLAKPKYSDPKRLNRFEHKVFSQMGEDGIIGEIFRRIEATDRTFVEFAAGDGAENNTLYLLTSGWTGVWIEAYDGHIRQILESRSREIQQGSLRLLHEFISAESIEKLFKKAGVPEEFDLLSIDIDRNDYWAWAALVSYRPRVVVIEYNAVFPPGCEWVVEYAPEATWDGTCRYGASLSALQLLGSKKGYQLVGCNLGGTNAFFVREDLVGDRFCSPFTAENHFEPARYYLAGRSAGHPRSGQYIWRQPFLINAHGSAR